MNNITFDKIVADPQPNLPDCNMVMENVEPPRACSTPQRLKNNDRK